MLLEGGQAEGDLAVLPEVVLALLNGVREELLNGVPERGESR